MEMQFAHEKEMAQIAARQKAEAERRLELGTPAERRETVKAITTDAPDILTKAINAYRDLKAAAAENLGKAPNELTAQELQQYAGYTAVQKALSDSGAFGVTEEDQLRRAELFNAFWNDPSWRQGGLDDGDIVDFTTDFIQSKYADYLPKKDKGQLSSDLKLVLTENAKAGIKTLSDENAALNETPPKTDFGKMQALFTEDSHAQKVAGGYLVLKELFGATPNSTGILGKTGKLSGRDWLMRYGKLTPEQSSSVLQNIRSGLQEGWHAAQQGNVLKAETALDDVMKGIAEISPGKVVPKEMLQSIDAAKAEISTANKLLSEIDDGAKLGKAAWVENAATKLNKFIGETKWLGKGLKGVGFLGKVAGRVSLVVGVAQTAIDIGTLLQSINNTMEADDMWQESDSRSAALVGVQAAKAGDISSRTQFDAWLEEEYKASFYGSWSEQSQGLLGFASGKEEADSQWKSFRDMSWQAYQQANQMMAEGLKNFAYEQFGLDNGGGFSFADAGGKYVAGVGEQVGKINPWYK
jgi:hypothetical protein